MEDLEKRLLSDIDLKPYLWWRFIDDILIICKHGVSEFVLKKDKQHSPNNKFNGILIL